MSKLYGYELPPEFKYEEIENEFKIYLPEGGSLEGVFFTVPKEYTEDINGRLKITLKNKDVIYLFNEKKRNVSDNTLETSMDGFRKNQKKVKRGEEYD